MEVMEYTIINKADIPDATKWGKWQRLFPQLLEDQAIKMEFPSMHLAGKQRNALQGSFRRNRTTHSNLCLKTRIVRDGNKVNLFVWTEKRE